MIELFSYPHHTLETVSTPWDWKTDTIEHHADLEKFEHEMIQFMKDERGLGLAANQIGITKRFFAIGHESFDTISKPAIIWNPKIIKSSKEKVIDVEGCLSFMDVWIKVERPRKVGPANTESTGNASEMAPEALLPTPRARRAIMFLQ